MNELGRAVARIGATVLGVLALGACSPDYYARRDTLSPGSGNAIQADIAAQVADPHPESADRVGGTTDGDYLQHAVERYRNPSAGTVVVTPPTAVPVER